MNPKVPKLLLAGSHSILILPLHPNYHCWILLAVVFEMTKAGKQHKNYLVPNTTTEQPPSLG